MQFPLQVTFQHTEPSHAIEELIREKAAKLERFYDRIVSCRVVVEASKKPHRIGDQYRVRIDLKVPGDAIVVNRDPASPDEPNELTIAVRDSFDAARRQLEDFARRQRGEVKTHEKADVGA